LYGDKWNTKKKWTKKPFDQPVETWNLDTIKTPYAMCFPTTYEEISKIIKFSNENNINLCISCGRHSIKWNADDALVLNLNNFRKVSVEDEIVTVQGGSLVGDVDKETFK